MAGSTTLKCDRCGKKVTYTHGTSCKARADAEWIEAYASAGWGRNDNCCDLCPTCKRGAKKKCKEFIKLLCAKR